MKPIEHFFPAPGLSLGLAVLWLLLTSSLDPGNVVLAALLGLLLPFATRRLRPNRIPIRRPDTILRLFLRVGGDTIVQNLQMVWQILRMGKRPPRSGFVVIPLDLHNAAGLAALSTIVTVIPGTVWNEISLDRRELLLHIFDLPADEQTLIDNIKTRYEKPLMEIFQ